MTPCPRVLVCWSTQLYLSIGLTVMHIENWAFRCHVYFIQTSKLCECIALW